MTVGENIKRIRATQGISQKRLADSMGVSSSMIAQYENGKKNPKISTIKRIAAVLGCTAEDIDEDLNKPQSFDTPEDFEAAWLAAGGGAHPQTSKDIQLRSIAMQLNDKGLDKVIDYATDLAGNSSYKRKVTIKKVTHETSET